MSIIKVKTGGITADAITDALIADDVVGTEHLTANEVDTTALGADAVTGAQLADDAVNSEHYTDGSIDTAHIADANVTTAKVADDAITAAKINNDIISGTTALAAEPADTDEFLVSDAGTLKRIDYSLIKGGGITVANQWRYTGGESLSAGSVRELINNLEEVDTGGQGKIGTSMSVSSGVWTFPSTGIYLVEFNANYYATGSSRYIIQSINATTNNSSFTGVGESYSSVKNVSSATYQSGHVQSLIDVTDTSNVKVQFSLLAHDNAVLQGSTTINRTYVTFTRLGDT